jgi:hypothetical protein
MLIPFTPDNDDSGTEVLEYAVALTRTVHAMSDYLLSSDTVLQDFCRFYASDGLAGHELPRPTDTEAEEMSGALNVVHDTFAAMAARAQRELFLAQLTGVLDGGNVSPDTPAH